jgi:hypothetical protein
MLFDEWAGIGFGIVCDGWEWDIIPSILDDWKWEKSNELDDILFKSLWVIVWDG